MKEKNFYSVQSVAEELELNEQTIKSYIYEKKLKAYKIGRVWRITKEDLLNFVHSQPSNFDEEKEE